MAEYYNSQLVRFFHAIDILHSADYGFEDAFELYHKIQEHDRPDYASGLGLPALGHALAGSAGTAISHVLLYPLDLVITRLQVQKQLRGPREAPSAALEAEDAEYSSLQDAAKKIYNNEGGLTAFWNGCTTSTSRSVIDSFLFFLAYTALRQHRQRSLGSKNLPVLHELSVGIAAGAFSKFVTTPIQQVVTRKQTAALVAARDPTSTLPPGLTGQLSVKDIALQIRSERGLKGFWAGYSASLILTLNPAITFLLQNLLKRMVLPQSKRENPGPKTLFLIAAVSKACASTITYPFSLAKSRAQVSKPAMIAEKESVYESEKLTINSPSTQSNKPTQKARNLLRETLRIIYTNLTQLAVIRSLRTIYSTEGTKGLYSGLDAEVVKGFLGHGLSMVLKERIHLLILSTYYTISNIRLTALRDSAANELRKARTSAGEAVVDASERVRSVSESATERVRSVGESVAEGVRSAVSDQSAGRAVSDARDRAGEVASGVSEKAGEVASGASEKAGQMAGGASERARNVAESVAEGVRNVVSDENKD